MELKRGQIYYADLSPAVGSEQGGLRPVLIIQNDIGNLHSPTTIIAPITSRMSKAKLSTHFYIDNRRLESGSISIGLVLMEQIRVIDKSRLKSYVGGVKAEYLPQIGKAIAVSLGI